MTKFISTLASGLAGILKSRKQEYAQPKIYVIPHSGKTLIVAEDGSASLEKNEEGEE